MGCRERKIHVGGEHLLCLMSLMIMVSRLAISLWREGGREEVGYKLSCFKLANREPPIRVLYTITIYHIASWMITLTKHESAT